MVANFARQAPQITENLLPMAMVCRGAWAPLCRYLKVKNIKHDSIFGRGIFSTDYNGPFGGFLK